ncbi:hypothetical protein Dip518_000410 [Parelusimicrobium proximum]|uniref:hypothetical protein n=1 Tax=Parelusimicrobium proximum TaxID=3228953 RepID=UPI003D172E75
MMRIRMTALLLFICSGFAYSQMWRLPAAISKSAQGTLKITLRPEAVGIVARALEGSADELITIGNALKANKEVIIEDGLIMIGGGRAGTLSASGQKHLQYEINKYLSFLRPDKGSAIKSMSVPFPPAKLNLLREKMDEAKRADDIATAYALTFNMLLNAEYEDVRKICHEILDICRPIDKYEMYSGKTAPLKQFAIEYFLFAVNILLVKESGIKDFNDLEIILDSLDSLFISASDLTLSAIDFKGINTDFFHHVSRVEIPYIAKGENLIDEYLFLSYTDAKLHLIQKTETNKIPMSAHPDGAQYTVDDYLSEILVKDIETERLLVIKKISVEVRREIAGRKAEIKEALRKIYDKK